MQVVPRVIHQAWVGPRRLPTKFKRWCRQWKTSHPDWEYRWWGNKEVDKLNLPLTGDGGVDGDLIRYEILYRMGGVWLDVDMIQVGSLNKLPPTPWLCIGSNRINGYHIGAIGGAPGQEIFRKAQKLETHWDPVDQSGPRHFMRVADAVGIDDFTVLPDATFYPFPLGRIKRMRCPGWRDELGPETIAAHYWAGTWL